MVKIKAPALKKAAAKASSALRSMENLVVRSPMELERFRIIVHMVTQTIGPMYAPLVMGIAHGMWSTTPDLDLNGTFLGIGIAAALVFIVMVAILVMLIVRCCKGGPRMMMQMRSIIALYVLNLCIFVVGVVYAGVVLLCKTVQYSSTAVCVANNAMSLSVLELFLACLIFIKEALYAGFRMAELKCCLEYDDGSPAGKMMDRVQNAAKKLQAELKDQHDDEEEDDEDDGSSVVGMARGPSRFVGKIW